MEFITAPMTSYDHCIIARSSKFGLILRSSLFFFVIEFGICLTQTIPFQYNVSGICIDKVLLTAVGKV